MVPIGKFIGRGIEGVGRLLSGETEQHLLAIVDRGTKKLREEIERQRIRIQTLGFPQRVKPGTRGDRLIGYDLSLAEFGMEQLVEKLERLGALRQRVTKGEIKTREQLEKELKTIV